MPLILKAVRYRGNPIVEPLSATLDVGGCGAVGSARDNFFVLPDVSVSEYHGWVAYDHNKGYVYTNLNEKETYLPQCGLQLGKQENHILTDGDLLKLGEYELEVHIPDERQNAPPPLPPLPDIHGDQGPVYSGNVSSGVPPPSYPEEDEPSFVNQPDVAIIHGSYPPPKEILEQQTYGEAQYPAHSSYESKHLDGHLSSIPIEDGVLLTLGVVSYRGVSPVPPLSQEFDQKGGGIGRIPTPQDDEVPNTLVLPDHDRYVSARHGWIDYHKGVYTYTDVSTNGSRLNNTPLVKNQSTSLSDGDILELGEYKLKVTLRFLARPDADFNTQLFEHFLKGAGLSDSDWAHGKNLQKEMEKIGVLFRVMLEGIVTLLKAREEIKKVFFLPITRIPDNNNPLKFYPIDKAIRFILGEAKQDFLPPQEAIKEGFTDLENHQLAMILAIDAWIEHVLKQLDPKSFEEDIGSKVCFQKKSKCWDAFCKRYPWVVTKITDNFLKDPEFAEIYEEKIKSLTRKKR